MIKINKSFVENQPLLYLLATPIGNLKDISYRAIETLKDADLIACEDTRNTKKLINFYDISKPLFSLHEHNERQASETIVKEILDGKKVIYCSDAGYPLVSDPGFILVQECLKNNINVSLIPGPCAFLNGMLPSGFNTEHFYFHGFLSAKPSQQITELKKLKNKTETMIFYESPHRILKTLASLYTVFGDRNITIGRELTKIHEEYIHLNLSEYKDLDEENLKGEMVIVCEGCKENNDEPSIDKVVEEINELKKEGKLSNRDIASLISDKYSLRKKDVYDLVNKN